MRVRLLALWLRQKPDLPRQHLLPRWFPQGYCQGMSDLLAPIVSAMESDELDSFWCFAALMDAMEGNFHRDQSGMHSQLLAVRRLVECLDPELHAHLAKVDALNYFFCFRWILIAFKREFSYGDVMRLWEAFWSHHMARFLSCCCVCCLSIVLVS